jgi:hypothetical protein
MYINCTFVLRRQDRQEIFGRSFQSKNTGEPTTKPPRYHSADCAKLIAVNHIRHRLTPFRIAMKIILKRPACGFRELVPDDLDFLAMMLADPRSCGTTSALHSRRSRGLARSADEAIRRVRPRWLARGRAAATGRPLGQVGLILATGGRRPGAKSAISFTVRWRVGALCQRSAAASAITPLPNTTQPA